MTKAIKNFAEVYAAYLNTITIGGDKEVALAYAVKDMMNQVKGMTNKDAIAVINDEAAYLSEKMAKRAA